MPQVFRFAGPLASLPPRCNAAPTRQAPIVRRTPGDGERELARVCWGFIPFSAKDATIGYNLIDARAERNTD
jgi:putative SOS response-associated peptidase YedK